MESLNKFRQKAKAEGRKSLSGIMLSKEASAILEAERLKSGESIAQVLNRSLIFLGGPSMMDPADSIIQGLRDEGKNPQYIKKYLNTEKIPSPGGGEWVSLDVVSVMKRLGV